MRGGRILAIAAGLAFIGATSEAHADGDADLDAEHRAAALFERGRALAREGKCGEAIPVLIESVTVANNVGPLLNLGHCHETLGKTFTAYRYFVDAGQLARVRRDDRAAEAEGRARALEPKLSTVTIRVVDPNEPGLELRLDDEPFDRSASGVPRKTDPGLHVLSVSSQRRGAVSFRVTVGANADRAELVVPALAALPSTERVASPVAEGPPATTSAGRKIGWIMGGVGVTALAVGGVFGIMSVSDHSSVVDRCPAYPSCPGVRDPALDDRNDAANTNGTVASIALVSGLAIGLIGAVLVLTAPVARAQ